MRALPGVVLVDSLRARVRDGWTIRRKFSSRRSLVPVSASKFDRPKIIFFNFSGNGSVIPALNCVHKKRHVALDGDKT